MVPNWRYEDSEEINTVVEKKWQFYNGHEAYCIGVQDAHVRIHEYDLDLLESVGCQLKILTSAKLKT